MKLRRFDDASLKAAEDARLELELKLTRAGVEHEVVLLDAPSEEAVRHTHGRYFDDIESVLAKLGASANGQ